MNKIMNGSSVFVRKRQVVLCSGRYSFCTVFHSARFELRCVGMTPLDPVSSQIRCLSSTKACISPFFSRCHMKSQQASFLGKAESNRQPTPLPKPFCNDSTNRPSLCSSLLPTACYGRNLTSKRYPLELDSVMEDNFVGLESVKQTSVDEQVTPSFSFEAEESMLYYADVARALENTVFDSDCVIKESVPDFSTFSTGSEDLKLSDGEVPQETAGEQEEGEKLELKFEGKSVSQNNRSGNEKTSSAEVNFSNPDFLLSLRRWQHVLHSRFHDPRPQYVEKVLSFFSELRQSLVHVTTASAAMSTQLYKSTASLHSDALLILVEAALCDGEESIPSSNPCQENENNCLKSRSAAASPGVLLLVDVLMQHFWDRSVELSSKHVVHLATLLHGCLGSQVWYLPINAHGQQRSVFYYTVLLWCSYVQRQNLRRQQNAKCLQSLVELSLLARPKKFSAQNKKKNSERQMCGVSGRSDNEWHIFPVEGESLNQLICLERETISHLFMRYMTSKESDVKFNDLQDTTALAEYCLTHCWHRLRDEVRVAGLAWLAKHKSLAHKDDFRLAVAREKTFFPRYLANTIKNSFQSPKEAFHFLSKEVKNTNNFSILSLDRLLLKNLRYSTQPVTKHKVTESSLPSAARTTPLRLGPLAFLYFWDDTTPSSSSLEMIEDRIRFELNAISASKNDSLLVHLDRLHEYLPLHSRPSDLAEIVAKEHPSLCSILVFHILCREWTGLWRSTVVGGQDIALSTEFFSSSSVCCNSRKMVKSLRILLLCVNRLDVVQTVLHLLPALGNRGFSFCGSSLSSAALAPPVLFSVVVRCVIEQLSIPCARASLQQATQERELSALPCQAPLLYFFLQLKGQITNSLPIQHFSYSWSKLDAQQVTEMEEPRAPPTCNARKMQQLLFLRDWRIHMLKSRSEWSALVKKSSVKDKQEAPVRSSGEIFFCLREEPCRILLQLVDSSLEGFPNEQNHNSSVTVVGASATCFKDSLTSQLRLLHKISSLTESADLEIQIARIMATKQKRFFFFCEKQRVILQMAENFLS